MKNIAIVEDEDNAAKTLSDFIETFSKKTGQQFNLVRFKTGADILEHYQSMYSVIFMDIQLTLLNGMSVAKEIRALDKTASIIFITNLVQYAQKGYDVDAVGFLVKPVSYYDFSMKFQKALDINVMNEERSITLNLPSGLCRISTDKLMYVEIIRHRLYYHLIDSVVEMTGVLGNVEKELKAYGFLRCKNCYLVNPKFVVGVKNSEVQVGNVTLQISRPRRATFMAELANWFAGNGNGGGF